MTGQELRAWREHWLFSQADLAKVLGAHINTIGLWERDKRPIPDMLPLALETLERRRLASLQQRPGDAA